MRQRIPTHLKVCHELEDTRPTAFNQVQARGLGWSHIFSFHLHSSSRFLLETYRRWNEPSVSPFSNTHLPLSPICSIGYPDIDLKFTSESFCSLNILSILNRALIARYLVHFSLSLSASAFAIFSL